MTFAYTECNPYTVRNTKLHLVQTYTEPIWQTLLSVSRPSLECHLNAMDGEGTIFHWFLVRFSGDREAEWATARATSNIIKSFRAYECRDNCATQVGGRENCIAIVSCVYFPHFIFHFFLLSFAHLVKLSFSSFCHFGAWSSHTHTQVEHLKFVLVMSKRTCIVCQLYGTFFWNCWAHWTTKQRKSWETTEKKKMMIHIIISERVVSLSRAFIAFAKLSYCKIDTKLLRERKSIDRTRRRDEGGPDDGRDVVELTRSFIYFILFRSILLLVGRRNKVWSPECRDVHRTTAQFSRNIY